MSDFTDYELKVTVKGMSLKKLKAVLTDAGIEVQTESYATDSEAKFEKTDDGISFAIYGEDGHPDNTIGDIKEAIRKASETADIDVRTFVFRCEWVEI